MTAPRGPVGRALTGALWLAAALALLAALALASGADPAAIGAALHGMPPWAWAAIAAVQAGLILAAAVKWALILARTAPALPRIGLGVATAATTLGTLAGQVMPIQLVTPALRAWAARRRGIPVPVALGTSALEQVFEVIVLLAIGGALLLPALLALPPGPALQLGLVAGLAMTGLLIAATRPAWRLAGRLFTALAARLGGRLASAAAALARACGAALRLDLPALGTLTALSCLRYAAMAGMNAAVLHALVPEAPIIALLAAFPLIQLLTALPVFPGGLGVVELTWSGTLIAAGVPPGPAVEAALTLRIVTLTGFLIAVPVLLAPLMRPAGRAAVA